MPFGGCFFSFAVRPWRWPWRCRLPGAPRHLEAVPGTRRQAVDQLLTILPVRPSYPVPEVALQVRDRGAAIMVDATQAAGRFPLHARDWGIDYLVVSAHKLYGPKGVGALISPVGDLRTQMSDLIWASEGTPNVPGIAGFGEACRLRRLEMAEDLFYNPGLATEVACHWVSETFAAVR